MWHQVFSHHYKEFPHILLIIELILVTPYSSATVGRGFSMMGRILSNTRLGLSNYTLDDLMVVKINLHTLQKCDPTYEQKLIDKAVDLYFEDKRRRESTKKADKTGADSLVGSNTTTEDRYLPVPTAAVLEQNALTRDEPLIP
ncbi:hypothetical protein SNE40_005109 [Patella caerulea]|uniref:HAT C-terminal dimerisation domain-containing protein n=1 Tax=Patella caerulea TaxID=87958 RepID=A0AAN8K6X9_PATCE